MIFHFDIRYFYPIIAKLFVNIEERILSEEQSQQEQVFEQSPNWEERKHLPPGDYRKGWPFKEGFPKNHYGKIYTIIDWLGNRFLATLDLSRQYRDEGIEWKPQRGINIYPSHIMAWKEGDWLSPEKSVE